MTPRLRAFDRIVVLLLGLVLVAAGPLVLDWRYDVLLHLPKRLDTGSVEDVLATAWWPGVFAAVTVILALLALWWLLSHVPTPGGRVVRTLNGDPSGTTRLDLTSVANATAARFEDLAPVLDASGTYRRSGGQHVVEVRAAVDDRTSAQLVAEAVGVLDAELQDAFEDGGARLRVLLGSPRRLPSWGRQPAETTTGAVSPRVQ